MTHLYSSICDFHETVFRNTIGVHLGFNEFDDLTDDKEEQAFAHKSSLSPAERFTEGELKFNAIDYIFQQNRWIKTRFGDGSYPVWYAAKRIETTFYETVFHWRQRYVLKPQGFIHEEEPICSLRSVFKVQCDAALIDFRNQVDKHKELVDPDLDSYPQTQRYGRRLYIEGHPGLISKSARYKSGENVVVFNDKILSSPAFEDDYIYEFEPDPQKIVVKKVSSDKKILEIL